MDNLFFTDKNTFLRLGDAFTTLQFFKHKDSIKSEINFGDAVAVKANVTQEGKNALSDDKF